MSTQPPRPWWENPRTDWTTGDPGRLLEALSAAYPPRAAVMVIAGQAGFDWDQVPAAPDPMRDAWLWVLNRAARTNCVVDLLANVVCDPSAAEAYPAVAWFLGEALGPAMARCAAVGLEAAAPARADRLPVEGLQAITSLRSGLVPIRTHLWTINELDLRTASIRVRGVPAGTGVLVGDDLLLTAAHVIGARNWQSVDPASIEAVFDFTYQPERSMAGIGTSIFVSEVMCGSPPTDSEIAGNAREDTETPFKYLDYALLRLSSPATSRPADGSRRGHYMLRSDEYGFEIPQAFYLAQCPLGGFVMLTLITNTPELNESKTRVSYLCNTSYGSSGGPMVDSQGRLVAIHQYTTGRTNQGVPVSAIANHLLSAHLLDTVTVNEVTHLGQYTATARDEVCRRIGVRWQVVASELSVPPSVTSPLAMWEWLRSGRKLYQLRGAFIRLGYRDLVEILDRDLLDQSHIRELSRLDEMSSQADRLLKSVSRGRSAARLLNLIVATREAPGLTRDLRAGIESLPAWQDDERLEMTWRMDWGAGIRRAKKAIDTISGILPVRNSDERQALDNVPAAIVRAREVESAIAALSELARSWPLVA